MRTWKKIILLVVSAVVAIVGMLVWFQKHTEGRKRVS